MPEILNSEESTSVAKTRRTDSAARAADALQLRLSGLGFEAIAERLGYRDKSGAWRAVEGQLKQIRRERATEVVSLDLARMDRLLTAVWEKAMKGDPLAVDRVLKILERRAKYYGLDGHAESTEAELAATRELFHSEVLGRLAENQDKIRGRLVVAIAEELDRMAKGLPTIESPWEDATMRLESLQAHLDETGELDEE